MKRRTIISSIAGLLATTVCLPAGEDRENESKPGTREDSEDGPSYEPLLPDVPNRLAKQLNLTPFGDLEDGCLYALLAGGFASRFVELIRFTKWERILVTTTDQKGLDTTVTRRRSLKGGALFSDKKLADVFSACVAAIDAQLPPDKSEIAGDDTSFVMVARKAAGKITYRARIFMSDEFLEPELRRVMAHLWRYSANQGVAQRESPAPPPAPDSNQKP